MAKVKAAIIGSQHAMDKLGVRIPIITHVGSKSGPTMRR